MFPFSNSAGLGTVPPAQGIGTQPIPPPPVLINCHDSLTVVPFSVPFTSTVNVSGGGAALQTAVTAAIAGTRLMILDSLDYDPIAIVGKTDLTIEAAAGQTPSITADPGPGESCIEVENGNSGLALRGLLFIGSGNGGFGIAQAAGLVNGYATGGGPMISMDRIIIEDCTFSEPAATATTGAPGIQFIGTDGSVHQNVWIHRCTFLNNAGDPITTGNGYGMCTVGGFSNVYVQNCEAIRQDGVLLRTASHARGYVFKSINVVVEDCLADDIGTAGSNEAFKHNNEAAFGTAVGTSSFRNCVAYNCKRFYRITLAGATMNVFNSVGHNDVVGIAAAQTLVQQSAGSLSFTDNVIVGAGDGTAFTAAVAVENHNDVFNFLATGKVLDPTDLTIDPLFEDVPNGDWLALAPACQTAANDGGLIGIRYAEGEKIIWCNH